MRRVLIAYLSERVKEQMNIHMEAFFSVVVNFLSSWFCDTVFGVKC